MLPLNPQDREKVRPRPGPRPPAAESGVGREPGRPVLSVVTCLFNEEDLVPELVRRVTEACRTLEISFEFLVVNDGSADKTLPSLVSLSLSVPELRIVNLFRRFGHMPALSAGLSLARGDAVVAMDGDLQDPPELIPRLVREWQAGAEVVYGLRTHRKEGAIKRAAIACFHLLLEKISETPIPRQTGTFSLMDRRIVNILCSMPERHRFLPGLRAWIGGNQSLIPYDRPDRRHGKSRTGMRGLFSLARTAFFSFSKVPLRIVSLFSLLCGLVLFLVGITAIAIRLLTDLAIPGWATYTTLLGVIGFCQSLVMALLSEYVAIIYDEIKLRPLFLVREEFAHGERIEEIR